MFKNLKLGTKIMAGSCIPLILVVALGFMCWSTIGSLLESSRMVDHTHTVIGDARGLLATAVDMETGMRGYLLAGRDEFLEPYTEGKQQFGDKLAALQRVVSDNPAQVQLLDKIKRNINEWDENVIEGAIALRREIGDAKNMNDLSRQVAKAEGKLYFDNSSFYPYLMLLYNLRPCVPKSEIGYLSV